MTEMKEDFFDKVMGFPVLRVFKPFYKRHKEVLLYLFFGGVAVLLNLGLFFLFDQVLKINELIANVICWIICVLFQFVTNRTWVFEAKEEKTNTLLGQMLSFFGGRLFTLGVEEAILAIFITWLMLNSIVVKIIAQIVIIVLNYIISKFVVFR